jgi:hypothetical protein
MKRLLPLFVTVACLGLFSCKKEAINNIPVQIRVQNLSSYTIQSVTIVSATKDQPYQQQYNYGSLGSNQTSTYLEQGIVYSVPTCKFQVNGQWKEFVPRCQLGLKELTAGRYTLKITTDALGNISYPEFTKD